MSAKKISRREMLKGVGLAAAGAALASCAPREPKVVTVKETVVVAGTPEVVEKVVTATPVIKKAPTVRAALLGAQAAADRQQPLVDGFTKKFPEATVELIPVSANDWDDYFVKLMTMIAAGEPPDATFVATEGVQIFAGQGVTLPLNDLVVRDKDEMAECFADIHPALVEAMMYEGSLYTLPNVWNAPNVYYNVKLFEEAGIGHPDPEWTKDDFYEAAKAVTKKDTSGATTTFGLAWANRIFGSWTPWSFANDTNLLVEERAPGGEWLWDTFYKDDPAAEGRGGGWRWPAPKANDPGNVEALEFMYELIQEGISPQPADSSTFALLPYMAAGQYAMLQGGGNFGKGLAGQGMAPDEFDVQFFPKWKIQRHQFGTIGYMILKSAQDPDLAWEWVKYCSSLEGYRLVKPGMADTPARRSLATGEEWWWGETGPEHWQVFYDTFDKYPNTAPIPAPPQSQAITVSFKKYTSLAMAGEMPVKEALDNMQAELEELFA